MNGASEAALPRTWRFYRKRFLPFGVWLFASILIAKLLGETYAAAPSTIRYLWLGPVALGGLVGGVTTFVGTKIGFRHRVLVMTIAALSGVSSFVHHSQRSIAKFAAVDAMESDDSKAARAFVEQLSENEDVGMTTDVRTRWLLWRTSPVGRLSVAEAKLVTFSELLLAGLAGALAAWLMSTPNASPLRAP